MTTFCIGLAQTKPVVAGFSHNLEMILGTLEQAQQADLDLVIFPEFALTGAILDDLATDPDVQVAIRKSFNELLSRLRDLQSHPAILLGGLAIHNNSKPTSRLWCIKDGQILGHYDKQVLATDAGMHQQAVLRPGSRPAQVFDIAGTRVGVAFADELSALSDKTLDTDFASGIDVLGVLAASAYHQGVLSERHELANDVSTSLSCPLAYVNAVGTGDELIFDGRSFFTSASTAAPSCHAAFLDTDLISVELDGDNTSRRLSDENTSPLAHLVSNDPSSELYSVLVFALREYLSANGFTRVALGLSGGIDSSLVAAIAADAIGGENVIGVSMPSKVSTDHSVTDAEDEAERLGIDYRSIAIEPLVTAFTTAYPMDGLALENIQARMRGMLLMSVANQEGPLVLATGNKSESAMGYATIYGDSVGGYAPIKDIYKTQVWQLARWRNNLAVDRGELPVIPENSITKPPSAELRTGQLDQDTLPQYEILDTVLHALLEERQPVCDVVARIGDAVVVEQVLRALKVAEWKRRQGAVGPRVSTRSLSSDRSVPISHSWNPKEELECL